MIRRLWGQKAARAMAAAAAAHPQLGLQALLWQAECLPIPQARFVASVPAGRAAAFTEGTGTMALYRCSGALLAACRGTGVLLGCPRRGAWEEIAAFLPLAGIGALYAPCAPKEGPLACEELWRMVCAPAAPAAFPPVAEGDYFAVARLLCADADAARQMYVSLCWLRNRGLVCVPALGAPQAPSGCAVLRGPLRCGGARTALLSDVYVAPQQRGRGGGSALVAAALTVARTRRAKKVALWCTQERAAFYARFGFAKAGQLYCLTPPK